MPDKNNNPINSLPEYEVRTMEDDINKLEGRPTDKKPLRLELPPTPPKQSLKPPSPPINISPPETLPIVTEKPVVAEKPKIEPIIEPITEKKSEIKKAPLPSIEDFITPAPPKPIKAESPKPESPKAEQPPIPVSRVEAPKIEKPIIEKPRKEKRIIPPEVRKRRTKIILIIFIIVLAIIAMGLFFYWQGSKPEPTPTPSPSNEMNIPDSLISVDETKILKIDNNASLENLLRDESLLNQQSGTVKRVVPTNSPTGEETNILPLNGLLEELRIVIYPYILSELSDNYNLIIYSQGTEKNIGLVVKTNNPAKIEEQLKYWEPTMADDLKNLFLFKKPGDPTTII